MPIYNKKVQDAIARAAVLNRAIKEAETELAGLKDTIRAEAEKVATKRGDDEKVEFESPEGVATVCFPRDKVTLLKGADPHRLQDTLPGSTWALLFQEKVVLNDGFEEAFEALKNGEKKAVAKLVEWKPATPRVTLPK